MQISPQLQDVIDGVSAETLIAFFQSACPYFRPNRMDTINALDDDQDLLTSLEQLGEIEFPSGDSLLILAGKMEGQQTQHRSRKVQHEITKKIACQENWADAGIFVFYDEIGCFRFGLVSTTYKGRKRDFSSWRRYSYYVSSDEYNRTFKERLAGCDFSSIESLQEAFSVEAVTKDFYKAYAETFHTVEETIAQHNDIAGEDLRMYTQLLFNRLMFLRFIEKKDWLQWQGETRNYLARLYQSGGPADQSFFQGRLKPLFFTHLAIEGQQQDDAVGQVPFLNGGLFERLDLDDRVRDIPDEAFAPILGLPMETESGGLFYRYNFTIEESTPLDIEVAVDPEMLGKVFEELVTGRHESGSYYTPRPIVSFMCREALKAYLAEKTSAPAEVIESIVDEHVIPERSLNQQHADEIRLRIDRVKACDPACGSGAYLLGLMQELIAIRQLLQNPAICQDAQSLYQIKLNCISHNLYGVDIDEFATNIAKLRLWLSLAVEADDPTPLPNLDFKIETGDSLLGNCGELLGPESMYYSEVAQRSFEIARLDEQYLNAHHHEEKLQYKEARERQTQELKGLLGSVDPNDPRIVWYAEFPAVFAPRNVLDESTNPGDSGYAVTRMYSPDEPGGFDIVLANPPYVRQELIKHLKPQLKEVFGKDIYSGTADLYTYFYARAVQMLAPKGVLGFISPNKFFHAAYGKKLRKFLGQETRVLSITDFGDSPIFEAAAYPMIFMAQKGMVPIQTLFTDTRVPGPANLVVKTVVQSEGKYLAPECLADEGWSFADQHTSQKIEQMKAAGIPLKDYVNGNIYRGILTGCNQAFVIDGATRELLIAEDHRSDELIKPLLMGRDVKRWTYTKKDRWLIFTRRGTDIEDFPAIKRYLLQYREQLEPRPVDWEQNHPGEKWPGRKPGPYQWYEIQDNIAYHSEFGKPKLVFPDIATEARVTFDLHRHFSNDTTMIIPLNDLFLLGLLNSPIVHDFYKNICAQIRGGFLRYKKLYVEQIPIPEASEEEKQAIIQLVQLCLDANGENCEAYEAEINQRVAQLYGLGG